jgi:tryptophan-rich sensory protein
MTAGGSWLLPAVVAILSAMLVAGIGSTLTDLGPWYKSLNQPAWNPPDAVFPIAWTTIFALAAIAAVEAWRKIERRSTAEWMVGLFALNGALNILWSLIFFRLQRPDWALVAVGALWLSILVLIVYCGRHSWLAGLLLVPYLVWVSIAAALNVAVVQLNAPFR